jgi:spermidine synthase
MKPQVLMATAAVPGSRSELRCWRHDRDFSFRLGGVELMSSRAHGSEEQLAELALGRLGERAAAAVLVGGLGLGFTLARALALLGPAGRVVVAELVPAVVQWNRELLGHLAGHPLRDPRAEVVVDDVGAVLRAARARFDAVLLDVDNGPAGLTRAANDGLYGERGLAAVAAALRPGGVLAVWSAGRDRLFAPRLRRAGFRVDEVRTRARRTRGPVRTIWLGVRP